LAYVGKIVFSTIAAMPHLFLPIADLKTGASADRADD
jgi:hypothetical protein